MKKEFTFRLAIVCLIAIFAVKFGVGPMLGGNTKSEEWAKGKIEREQGKFDVIVLGEEPEGIAAAVSAARAGAKTLLVSQGDNLGGVISKSLLADLEPSLGVNGEILNRGFFLELYSKLGKNFTVEKYINIVNKIIKNEKNLEVLYNTSFKAPILIGNTIKGIVVNANGDKRELFSRMFIDATREGSILAACGVPYFIGSEDLNIKNSFLPASLNFIVEGISMSQIAEVLKKPDFYQSIREYQPSDIDIYLDNVSIVPQNKNRAIINGLEVFGLNMQDKNVVSKAYKSAAREAESFTAYLQEEFKEFGDIQLLKVADSLYFRESVHFVGEYVLEVNDILENRDFDDKVAVGSRHIDASKFVRNSSYVIGKPERYGIPMGCIVPLKTDNLLMVGSKASYSSLAASSAGALSVSIAEGQSAGILSVFSIVKNIKPRDIVKQRDKETIKEIQELFAKQGLKPEEFDINIKGEGQWSYPYLKQLIHLGLVAGGTDNEFGNGNEATEREFATLLLNGIYRLAPEKYNLELDSNLRKYFTEDKLTKEKAGRVLLSLYNKNAASGSAYNEGCKNAYIDAELQSRIKGKDVLHMEDVFYLSCFNIKNYTGKEILE